MRAATLPPDAAAIQAALLARHVELDAPSHPSTRRFLIWLAANAHHYRTAYDVARGLGIKPETLSAKFARARMPSLGVVLRVFRLAIVAGLCASFPAVSLYQVAVHLDQLPPALARFLVAQTGLQPSVWRPAASLLATLPRVRQVLLDPSWVDVTLELPQTA